MSTKTALFMVTAGSLLVFTNPLRGQEVASDVKIPPPREIVAGAPAVSGLFSGPASLPAAPGQAFQGVVAQAALGTLSELETREQLGDFMASLLVRAGIIAFDRQPARRADSGAGSEDGSRPAWTGRTPMTLSVSRTERSEVMRRR